MSARSEMALSALAVSLLSGGLWLAVTVDVVHAQAAPHVGHGAAPAPPPSAGQESHGTPRDWKFTWPRGDPVKGREVFVKLECYGCHEVRGERFAAPRDAERAGPELSAMGPVHEAEYFAEAIINPSAVIEKGKGYEAADASSKMPSYNDSVTVQEVVDLVAYLKSLQPAARFPPGAGGHGPMRAP